MKFHEELNPKIWDNNKIKPEVEKKLLEIAKAFEEYLEIPKGAVLDYRILGSNCNYNYTEHSDLDLHLVIDYNKVHKNCPLVEGYLWAMKNNFNREHDIYIYGIPVELYAEDAKAETISNGCYSVMNDEWIKRPEKIAPTKNDGAVKAKYEEMKEAIEKVEGSEEAAEILRQVYKMRKAGLADGGEFSTENLAFKRLRDEGLINKLREITKAHMDRELSLESLQESFGDNDIMAQVNELIFKLIGLKESFYGIHYRNVGYADHILAQRLYELFDDDLLDSLKEQVIMGHRELPLQSADYLKGAIPYIITVGEDNKANWISAWGLVDSVKKYVDELKTDDRAFNVLLDDIAGKCATASALIYLNTRRTPGLNEDVDVEHCDGCKETEVDREEPKEIKLEPDEAQKLARKYAEEAVMVGESALDRLAKKVSEI